MNMGGCSVGHGTRTVRGTGTGKKRVRVSESAASMSGVGKGKGILCGHDGLGVKTMCMAVTHGEAAAVGLQCPSVLRHRQRLAVTYYAVIIVVERSVFCV